MPWMLRALAIQLFHGLKKQSNVTPKPEPVKNTESDKGIHNFYTPRMLYLQRLSPTPDKIYTAFHCKKNPHMKK